MLTRDLTVSIFSLLPASAFCTVSYRNTSGETFTLLYGDLSYGLLFSRLSNMLRIDFVVGQGETQRG